MAPVVAGEVAIGGQGFVAGGGVPTGKGVAGGVGEADRLGLREELQLNRLCRARGHRSDRRSGECGGGDHGRHGSSAHHGVSFALIGGRRARGRRSTRARQRWGQLVTGLPGVCRRRKAMAPPAPTAISAKVPPAPTPASPQEKPSSWVTTTGVTGALALLAGAQYSPLTE